MSYQISQLDIPDRELLAINAPRVGAWTEIGTAEITHTMFGRAKVRIIRKDEAARRTKILVAALAGTALAVAAWLAWVEFRQTEPVQSTEISPTVAAPVQEGAPALQAVSIVPPAALPPVESEAMTPAPAEKKNPEITRKSVPQQPSGLAADEQAAARPARLRRPEAAGPVPTGNRASEAVAEKPLASRVSSPSTPAASVIAVPGAAKASEPPTPASPAAVSPLAVPPVKQDVPPPSPAAEKQPATPASVQSK